MNIKDKPRAKSVALVVSVTLAMLTSVFLAVLGYVNYRAQERYEIRQLQQELDYGADQLSSAIALPLWNFDQNQIGAVLESAMKFESVYGLILQPLNLDRAPSDIRMRDANWEVTRADKPFDTQGLLSAQRQVSVQGKPMGSITLFATTRFIAQRMQAFWLQTLASILVIDVLLVLSLYYVLWRTILRPLQRIENYAVQAGLNPDLGAVPQGRFLRELDSVHTAIVRTTALAASRLQDMRAQSERMLAKEQSARLNEFRVAQILAASPLPITVARFETGEYVRVNPAWLRIFNLQEEQALGQTAKSLKLWRDDAHWNAWLEQIHTHGRVTAFEAELRPVNGSFGTYLLSSERFHYGDGDCVLTMTVDMTERVRLASELLALNATLERRVHERTQDLDRSNRELRIAMESLQRAHEELVHSEKLASLGSLVAGVAHELNTPIGNALVVASGVAEDVTHMRQAFAAGSVKRSMFDHFLDRVGEGAKLTLGSLQRAVTLISSFKQIAVDQASERRRAFDLAETLGEVIATLMPNVKRAAVTVRLDLEPHVLLDSYPGPLGQVVMNLFTNALAHAFEDGMQGEIQVSAQRSGTASVTIRVSDNGLGIAPEHLGQIFDPFFTTKLGRGGSGLGLSVSHRIVTKVLGGHIAVRSRQGEGASFELVLPTTAPEVVG